MEDCEEQDAASHSMTPYTKTGQESYSFSALSRTPKGDIKGDIGQELGDEFIDSIKMQQAVAFYVESVPLKQLPLPTPQGRNMADSPSIRPRPSSMADARATSSTPVGSARGEAQASQTKHASDSKSVLAKSSVGMTSAAASALSGLPGPAPSERPSGAGTGRRASSGRRSKGDAQTCISNLNSATSASALLAPMLQAQPRRHVDDAR